MNILGWVKTNWIIVVSVAVMLIAPPIAWYFSTSMARETSAQREQDAQRQHREVGALRTTYSIPAVRPGTDGVSLTADPNRSITAWFREQNERLTSEMGQVVQEAVDFNRRGRGPVLDGVLPTPPDDRTARQTLLMEFANRFVPGGGGSVYERMLADLNAGAPISAVEVARTLQTAAETAIERRISESPDGQLTPEEDQEITDQLVQMRLGYYSRRARDISLYASLAVFPQASDREVERSPYFPRSQVAGVPTVEQCFRLQWDAWLAQDLLAAIKTANTDASGNLMPVEEAPIKRLIMVQAQPPAFASQPQARAPGVAPEPVTAGIDPATGLIQPSFDSFLTGRPPSELNQLYDAREAAMLVHVDSARLPQVIEAFARTNFMTVTDVNITNVDLDAELRSGYFYGDDHVVQVQFTVEVLYLRQWTRQFMPPSIRVRLGLPETDPEPEGDDRG